LAEPLDDAELRRLAAEQESVMKKHLEYLAEINKNNKDSLANFLKEKKNWNERRAAVDDFIKQTKTIAGPNAFGGLIKGVKGSFAALGDVKDDLRILDSVIEKTTDAEEKRLLGVKREELVRKSINSTLLGSAVDFAGSIRKLAIGGIVNTTSSFVRGLQNNSSATDLSSTLMTGAVDIATGAVGKTGEALGKAGEFVSGFGGKAKYAGLAAQGLGMALTGFSETANKVAKFGIEVLSKEVEKTIKVFNDTNSSGALFANGMTGMRNAASNAGLNLEQFSNVLKKNSEDLGKSGLGVTEGMKIVGRVSKTLKESGVSTELQRLGYGFEEQASLIAETTANMRRSAGSKSSDAEIATQTAKYAESLRTIAAITGEDAKKKTEEAKAQNQILAFQQEMAKKTPEQRAAIDAAMATMNEVEKKNLRDRMVFGEVINKEGAIYQATMAGAREKGEAQMALLNQNQLTAESNSKLNAQFGAQLRQSGLNNTAIGAAALAGVGGLEGVSKAILDTINQSNIYTEDAVKNGKTLVQQQKATNDALTNSVIDAAESLQDLKIELQDTLLPAIGMFADVSSKMLQVVKDQLKDLNLSSGTDEDEQKSTKQKWADRFGKVGRGALEYGGGAIGGVAASLIPGGQGIGTVLGAGLGQQGGKALADLIGLPQFAQGGITSGLSLAGEAGPEAVIPLDNSRSVPVKLTMNDLNSKLDPATKSMSGMEKSFINDRSQREGKFPSTETAAQSLINASKGFRNSFKGIDLSSPDFSNLSKTLMRTFNLMSEENQNDSAFKVQTSKSEADFSGKTVELLTEQINLMREYISKADDQITMLSDAKSLQQQLVNNSYS
jgi:hypothetical protein